MITNVRWDKITLGMSEMILENTIFKYNLLKKLTITNTLKNITKMKLKHFLLYICSL
jgi:hypothetical protein